jgi:hypothetical protein
LRGQRGAASFHLLDFPFIISTENFMSLIVSSRGKSRLATAVCLLLVVGCFGPSAPPRPKAVPVSGLIMYQDKPLADAQVSFVSALDNKDVFPARGMTNSSGEFTLTSYVDPEHEVAGATPGDFVVTVTKTPKRTKEEVMEEFQKNPAMEFKSLVPKKYANAKETTLKATVTADGKNRFEFKLED